MDIDTMKNRVLEFLRSENITSAQFAQEIGVQPSGISHIISGRNKPSLDFVVKMLARYPALSTDWLLLGKGPMFREGNAIDIFQESKSFSDLEKDIFSDIPGISAERTSPGEVKNEKSDLQDHAGKSGNRSSSRIVIFNSDGTFSEHFPE